MHICYQLHDRPIEYFHALYLSVRFVPGGAIATTNISCSMSKFVIVQQLNFLIGTEPIRSFVRNGLSHSVNWRWIISNDSCTFLDFMLLNIPWVFVSNFGTRLCFCIFFAKPNRSQWCRPLCQMCAQCTHTYTRQFPPGVHIQPKKQKLFTKLRKLFDWKLELDAKVEN